MRMYIKSQCIKMEFFLYFTLVSANGVFTSTCQSLSQRSGKNWRRNVPFLRRAVWAGVAGWMRPVGRVSYKEEGLNWR